MSGNGAAKTHAGGHPGPRVASSQESELVRRIIATPSFARSPFLTNFLLYVCDRKAEGRDEEITEYQIGVQALGRPASYSPGEDNIVRNYARILRKRLDEYFAGEGRNEVLRVAIPRGRYLPVYELNSPATESAVQTEVPGSSPQGLPVSEPPPEAVAAESRSGWHGLRVVVPVSLVACIAALLYWGAHKQSREINDVFWEEIFDRSRPTYVVTGDSGLAMLQDLTGIEIHLNDYITGNLQEKFANFKLDGPRQNAIYGADRFSNYTSTADLSIALSISNRAQLYRNQLKVVYAREMHMEDLKRSNAILLGGPHANPWVELFEPESNFRMEFPGRLAGMHKDERLFINKHPRAGEQAVYANLAGTASHLTYALVSFRPGADGAGHVLLLEGENMAGTRSAGDFILDRRAMQPVLTKARLPDGTIGSFELLLEARTVGANAPMARVAVERYGAVKAE